MPVQKRKGTGTYQCRQEREGPLWEPMAQGEARMAPGSRVPTPFSVADLWMPTGQGQQEKLDSTI
jgi:hypothetical protein